MDSGTCRRAAHGPFLVAHARRFSMTKKPYLQAIVLVACALASQPAFAQGDTLATVFGVPITREDFVKRFELSVYPGKDAPGRLDSTKMHVLTSLIAEKLLSLAPRDPGPDVTRRIETMRVDAEDTFVRDALFRREVSAKSWPTDQEVRNAMRVAGNDYTLDVFRFVDSVGAAAFLRAVTGLPPARLYEIVATSGLHHDSTTVSFGDLYEDAERAVFGKKPGALSRPVRTQDGYAVFRILGVKPNPKFASQSSEDRFTSTRKIMHQRRQDALGWEYLAKVMQGVRVEVNPGSFYDLAAAMRALLKAHPPERRSRVVRPTPEDFASMRATFGSRLSDTLLVFPDGTMSFGEGLTALSISDFAAQDTSEEAVVRGLHASFRFISQNRYLVRHARALGLQEAPEVQSDVQMFVDAVRATEVARSVMDEMTVTPAERDSFFAVHQDRILNDIRLLIRFGVVQTVSEATALLQRLQEPDDRTGDTSVVKTRWVVASEIGEYAGVLSRLEPGQVYGPVPGPTGYTVFKLLKKSSTVSDSALAERLELARKILLNNKRQNALDHYIANLADEAGVRIFRGNLLSTRVSASQMYTIRYIGFGGRVNAVPSITPRETWVRFSGRNVTVLP